MTISKSPRKLRNRVGLVILASLPLWFVLNYYPSHDFSGSQHPVLVVNNFVISLESDLGSGSSSLHPIEKVNDTENVLHVKHVGVAGALRRGFQNVTQPEEKIVKPIHVDPCEGKYIYIHNIPSRFNKDILMNCKALNKWSNMCHSISNFGLGPSFPRSEKAFASRGWFETDQFSLDIIFHQRMMQYKCMTGNSSQASAIFVPFYAGLDAGRFLWDANATIRDSNVNELFKWLRERPEWKAMGGKDHFMVAGRISWDFRRETDEDLDWGNKLLVMPESKNMTTLVIESSPWNNNDFAIPYPTYFHPSKANQIFQWQNRMRNQKRRFLYSFAGASRPNMEGSIRGEIISQCKASRKRCRLLSCSSNKKGCKNPANVIKMFQSSVFCLQPSGDSFTRRSTFDSILAGCIPVFFHPGSAYTQYQWHFPKDYTDFSVFIPEDGLRNKRASIEQVLRGFSKLKIMAMREEVIKLIPKIVYADPRSRLETFEDAFDVAVDGVLQRVEKMRKEPSSDFPENQSWKTNLDLEQQIAWEPLFSQHHRNPQVF